jgi:hypothetical protein
LKTTTLYVLAQGTADQLKVGEVCPTNAIPLSRLGETATGLVSWAIPAMTKDRIKKGQTITLVLILPSLKECIEKSFVSSFSDGSHVRMMT